MQTQSFFEGAEKKMEILLSPTAGPLTQKPEKFWHKLCKKARTHVVSSLPGTHCHSYILSESSLFVWSHHLVMLTCGESSLASALCYFLKQTLKEDINLIFYQRKNELAPRHQQSSFMEDAQSISKKIPGKAFCFGSPDEHHFHLFHSTHKEPETFFKDQTVEVLMYDLDERVKKLFFQNPSPREVRNELHCDQIIPHAQTDDYSFKPFGYSLNGFKGEHEYFTIHVSPQEPGFYVSFETNARGESPAHIIKSVVEIFKPTSFDTVLFSRQIQLPSLEFEGFTPYSHFRQRLSCGYEVCFSHFFQHCAYPKKAYSLTL